MLSLYFVMTTCSLLVHHFFIFSNKSINLKKTENISHLKIFLFSSHKEKFTSSTFRPSTLFF